MSIKLKKGVGNSDGGSGGGGGSTATITLLSITTAPTGTFEKGSKYYNSTTRLIYTATADDVWGTDGETPKFNTIYIYDNNGTTEYYQWDGDNLVETDLEKYQLKSNITDSFSSSSQVTYPSSKALKEGLATKQGTLTTQTAYTSKGTSTKVPQVTTNTLGQVTGITEVDISFPTEIPSQTGNSGKALTTNGNTVSWGNFVPAPTVLTDQSSTSMALAGNTIYKWTSALTSLSFASVEVSDLETVLYFTTGGTISFTDSSNLKWGGDGFEPSLEANTVYCISIRNGLAEIDTFGTVS